MGVAPVGLRENGNNYCTEENKPQRGERLVEIFFIFRIKPHRGDRFLHYILCFDLSIQRGFISILIPGFYQSIASMKLEGKA